MDEKSLYADPGKVPLCLKFSNGSQVVLKVGGSLVVGNFLRSAFKKMAASGIPVPSDAFVAYVDQSSPLREVQLNVKIADEPYLASCCASQVLPKLTIVSLPAAAPATTPVATNPAATASVSSAPVAVAPATEPVPVVSSFPAAAVSPAAEQAVLRPQSPPVDSVRLSEEQLVERPPSNVVQDSSSWRSTSVSSNDRSGSPPSMLASSTSGLPRVHAAASTRSPRPSDAAQKRVQRKSGGISHQLLKAASQDLSIQLSPSMEAAQRAMARSSDPAIPCVISSYSICPLGEVITEVIGDIDGLDRSIKSTITAPTQSEVHLSVHVYLAGSESPTVVDAGIAAQESIAALKEHVCRLLQMTNVSVAAPKTFGLRFSASSKVFLDDASLLNSFTIVQRSVKQNSSLLPGELPSLVVMHMAPRDLDLLRQEKLFGVAMGSIIGRPLLRTTDLQSEPAMFRQSMNRFRYYDRIDRVASASSMQASVDVPMDIVDEKTAAGALEKCMALVELPLLTVKKTIIMTRNETANEVRRKLFEKHYQSRVDSKLTVDDFILKLNDLDTFMDGDLPVSRFRAVIYAMKSNAKVEMALVNRQVLQGDLVPPPDEDPGCSEEMADPQVRYELASLDIASVQSPFDLPRFSLWDVGRSFRVCVLGVENVVATPEFQKLSGGTGVDDAPLLLECSAGIYYGGDLIGRIQTTSQALCDRHVRWSDWLDLGISTQDIPREARVCFKVWAVREGRSERAAIGFVSRLLFDFQGQLPQGVQTVGLWPDDIVNPIGTMLPNPSGSAAMFSVEFDSFQRPVVFPSLPNASVDLSKLIDHVGSPIGEDLVRLTALLSKDPLYVFNNDERSFIWKHRDYVMRNPSGGALNKLLLSVPYNRREEVVMMHRLLQRAPMCDPITALELLDAKYADARVRAYGVRCIQQFTDVELHDYLLQLVQVLKYEPYHISALAQFLVRCALRNRRLGHGFFWFLKSEVHVETIAERYGLLLETYLRGCGTYHRDLHVQDEMMKTLVRIANMIKDSSLKSEQKREVMLQELRRVTFPTDFRVPLKPSFIATGVVLDKCKIMDSKKLPLWLVFSNNEARTYYTIFKSGDDLRQDMLTLQMLRIMDRLWKQDELDLKMNAYGCISTGDQVGMIEVVLNSDTTANIVKQAGGATAAFRADPVANWLRDKNPSDDAYGRAVENFMLSCAGYCVATYVLGIGDRHNDNVMLTKDGCLFHIDFGHFLGNVKKKFGIKRERAPFVFTPDFAFVMGGRESNTFHRFLATCGKAYNILRHNAHLFINLFAMMLSTGMPELQELRDIEYLRNAFLIGASDKDAASQFTDLIYQSLETKTTQINNMVHILAH